MITKISTCGSSFNHKHLYIFGQVNNNIKERKVQKINTGIIPRITQKRIYILIVKIVLSNEKYINEKRKHSKIKK